MDDDDLNAIEVRAKIVRDDMALWWAQRTPHMVAQDALRLVGEVRRLRDRLNELASPAERNEIVDALLHGGKD